MDELSARRLRRPSRPPGPTAPLPNGVTLQDIADQFEPYRVTQARQLKLMSRADLAEALGGKWTPARLIKLESNCIKPHPLDVVKLAEVLDVPPAFFRWGRPMVRLSAADCHFRPSAFGRDDPRED